MRKLFAALAFVFLSALGFGQTTAVVTGNLLDQSETAASAGISVDVELANTLSQRCYVAGTGTVLREKQTYTAAQITAGITLAKNANITCGLTTGATQWKFTFNNSTLNTHRACNLQISGATNLDSAACLNSSPTPTSTVPTASLFCLIDGSNCGFTGNTTHNGHDDTGIGQLGVTGSEKLTETTAPSCATGSDLLWADSTAHRIKECDNNGAAVQIVHSGVDVNTLDQVTALHMAAPVPTTQGGTAQNSTAIFPTSGTVNTGTGTTNRVSKFTTGASGIQGDSSITDNGTAVSSTLPFTLTPNKQIFTSNGTFTIPSGVTAVKVTLVGGGGAGGGATATFNGGGGGSGGAAIKWLTGLTPANTIAVTVGTGGTGVSAAAGNAGTASSIASGTQTITTVTANGGGGGNANGTQSAGGNAGTIGTNGDINLTGNPGNGDYSTICGAPGAGSIFGGGGNDSNGGNPGNAAGSVGGGGGGAGAGAHRAGGNGAVGIVIFEWVN